MRVLAIETATDRCSVALAEQGNVMSEVRATGQRVHAEVLMSQIEEVLAENRFSVRDIDGIAVSVGPGSFTGLRIGVSAAKAIAWSLGIPVAAVPTLDAVAAQLEMAGGVEQDELIVAAIDARKGEIYRRLYQIRGGGPEPLGAEQVSSPEAVVKELAGRAAVVTGPSVQLRNLIGGGTYDRVRLADAETAACSAGSVALLGSAMLEAGSVTDSGTLEPRYVQQFEPKLRQRMV